jgi:O-antigen/teichoic acid export membrane protein
VRRRSQAAFTMGPTLVVQGSLVFSGVLSARLLGPDLRGYLTVATLLPGVVAAVASLGLQNTLAYYTARDRVTAPNLLATAFGIAIPLAVSAFLVNVVLFWLFFRDDPPDILGAALPTLLVAPALIIQLLVAAHLQGVARYTAMNAIRVTPYVLYAAGIVGCILLQARSLSLVVWAYTLAYGVVAVVSLIVMCRTFAIADWSAAPASLGTMLRFGARGAAVSLSPIETFRADQLLVAALLPTAAVAYYSVCTAFSVLPRLMTQSLGSIASAEIAAGTAAQRGTSVRSFLITAVILVSTTVIVLELLLPFLIPLLFGEAFLPALAGSRLLLLAAAALGIRRLVTDLARGFGRPEVESIVEIASWPLLAGGAVLTVSAASLGWGIEAVAASVLTASAASAALALGYLARIMRVPSEPSAKERAAC